MKTVIFEEFSYSPKYEIGGGLGSWAKSIESKPVIKGDVRVIGRVLMAAYHVQRIGWRRYETTWTPADDAKNSSEGLRAWMACL